MTSLGETIATYDPKTGNYALCITLASHPTTTLVPVHGRPEYGSGSAYTVETTPDPCPPRPTIWSDNPDVCTAVVTILADRTNATDLVDKIKSTYGCTTRVPLRFDFLDVTIVACHQKNNPHTMPPDGPILVYKHGYNQKTKCFYSIYVSFHEPTGVYAIQYDWMDKEIYHRCCHGGMFEYRQFSPDMHTIHEFRKRVVFPLGPPPEITRFFYGMLSAGPKW